MYFQKNIFKIIKIIKNIFQNKYLNIDYNLLRKILKNIKRELSYKINKYNLINIVFFNYLL